MPDRLAAAARVTVTTPHQRWTPTFAYLRAVLVAVLGMTAALVLRRPDLLVLASPMVAIALWGALERPRQAPTARLSVRRRSLREGQQTRADVVLSQLSEAELVSTSVAPSPYVTFRPEHGGVAHLLDAAEGDRVTVSTGVCPQRWGPRTVGPVLVAAATSWGTYRWGPVLLEAVQLTALPDPEVFDARAPVPHPRGLVGLHRSTRVGEGSEFASIRPFQWGDRLRRIHWARSLRSGELHVTSSHADQDTHVAIIVDAHYDLGASGGVEGPPSTLDHAVRAAAAIAEHFGHQGDRVSLQVLSGRTPMRVRPGAGRTQQHRLLQSLAGIKTGVQERIDPRRLRQGLGPGTLVVMVSALVSDGPLAQAVAMAQSGLQVVVIDVLIDDVEPPGEQDEISALAWRIRILERSREIQRAQAAGVPVVPWVGPGSLDAVLRSLARRGHRGVRA